jgi:hypothetical protein
MIPIRALIFPFEDWDGSGNKIEHIFAIQDIIKRTKVVKKCSHRVAHSDTTIKCHFTVFDTIFVFLISASVNK